MTREIVTLSENERRRLADYLRQYAHDVLTEWMRIVEIEQDTLSPASGAFHARARWQGDGSMMLSESPYGGEEFGHYRVTVHVEPIDVPPFGPENDLAMAYETADWELSTWGMVLAGDEVRLPGRPDSEMLVTSITPERLWHVKDGGTGKWWDDEAIEHITRTAKMKDRDGAVSLPPEMPIEIYMDATRHAELLLQATFPGSERMARHGETR